MASWWTSHQEPSNRTRCYRHSCWTRLHRALTTCCANQMKLVGWSTVRTREEFNCRQSKQWLAFKIWLSVRVSAWSPCWIFLELEPCNERTAWLLERLGLGNWSIPVTQFLPAETVLLPRCFCLRTHLTLETVGSSEPTELPCTAAGCTTGCSLEQRHLSRLLFEAKRFLGTFLVSD